MQKPDILVFMSDQHNPLYSSYMGGEARTPNMEKLANDGTVFTEAYTSCPLCVPARMSMLTGKLPSSTGIYTNLAAIPDVQPTFLHSLVKAGYETVLAGRMHFVGTDQYHGFTRRIMGDQTPVSWDMSKKKRFPNDPWFGYAEPMCISLIGGGDSPVLAYDRAVMASALEYLRQDHEKPQCIFVSLYGPHFPYCAAEELYTYYRDSIDVPENYHFGGSVRQPLFKHRVYNVSEKKVKQARSAYYGMIETIDRQLGEVRGAYNDYLTRNKHEGVFAYISDHGDHCGDKRMFGKTTFYDNSAKIPLILQGPGIKAGERVSVPASIMDLGATLCELAGTAPLSDYEGINLLPVARNEQDYADRYVISELLLKETELVEITDDTFAGKPHGGPNRRMFFGGGEPHFGRMVRRGRYKYVTFDGYEDYDELYDILSNPDETENLASSQPMIAAELRAIAHKNWDIPKLLAENKLNQERLDLLIDYEDAVGFDASLQWNDIPEESRQGPTVV